MLGLLDLAVVTSSHDKEYHDRAGRFCEQDAEDPDGSTLKVNKMSAGDALKPQDATLSKLVRTCEFSLRG